MFLSNRTVSLTLWMYIRFITCITCMWNNTVAWWDVHMSFKHEKQCPKVIICNVFFRVKCSHIYEMTYQLWTNCRGRSATPGRDSCGYLGTHSINPLCRQSNTQQKTKEGALKVKEAQKWTSTQTGKLREESESRGRWTPGGIVTLKKQAGRSGNWRRAELGSWRRRKPAEVISQQAAQTRWHPWPESHLLFFFFFVCFFFCHWEIQRAFTLLLNDNWTNVTFQHISGSKAGPQPYCTCLMTLQNLWGVRMPENMLLKTWFWEQTEPSVTTGERPLASAKVLCCISLKTWCGSSVWFDNRSFRFMEVLPICSLDDVQPMWASNQRMLARQGICQERQNAGLHLEAGVWCKTHTSRWAQDYHTLCVHK